MAQQKKTVIQGITFVVDGDLPQPTWKRTPETADRIIHEILSHNNHVVHSYLASSFGEEKLFSLGSDAFFQSILCAFCEHKSLVLSSDMIWLKILQTYSRHVNDSPEQYRHLTSVRDGKKTLVLQTKIDIFGKEVDWASIIDNLGNIVSENVKDGFTNNLVANFTTTNQAERIASQITILDTMKPYFEFIVHHMICGIPNITLLGTTKDWESIIEKVEILKIYEGLREWIEDLRPILQEFVNASKGEINNRFWRDIVMNRHPKEMHLGGCVPEQNPSLNGWILKFYSFDYEKDVLNHFDPNRHMRSEVICVPWKYVEDNGVETKTYPMEFWTGFVGTKFDSVHGTFEPVIGWFVIEADSDKDIAEEFMASSNGADLHLKVHGVVPTFLAEIKKFRSLVLDFDDGYVDIPEWMGNLEIEEFYVRGRFLRGDKGKLRACFKNIHL